MLSLSLSIASCRGALMARGAAAGRAKACVVEKLLLVLLLLSLRVSMPGEVDRRPWKLAARIGGDLHGHRTILDQDARSMACGRKKPRVCAQDRQQSLRYARVHRQAGPVLSGHHWCQQLPNACTNFTWNGALNEVKRATEECDCCGFTPPCVDRRRSHRRIRTRAVQLCIRYLQALTQFS